jgi:hypothetical protein
MTSLAARRGDADRVPDPSLSASRRGLAVHFAASYGPGGLELGSEDLAGVATERATGERTYAVQRRNHLGASLALGPRAPADGAAGMDELYTVTVDRDGRPIELAVLRGWDLAGHVPRIHGAVRRESEARLDLTDPDNLAAARDFLREVVSPRPRLGRAVEVSGALRRRFDEAGVLDERTYAMDEGTTGIGATAGSGVGHLGAEFERHEQRLRLVGARQRGPDGLWRARDDCLRA